MKDMNRNKPALHCAAASMAALLFALPSSAEAGAYISATTSSGPNSYRSNEINGNADLFGSPLSINAFGLKSSSTTAADISQSGFGLDWKTSKLATLGLKHNKVDNGNLDIAGNALNLALSLNSLWTSDLLTRVDLKAASSDYKFSGLPAKVKNDTINQTSSSFGLTQDITDWLGINGGRDQYSYDRDPRALAAYLMLNAPRKFINHSSNLLSFPDSTNRFGLTWRPLEALTIDISSSRTKTLFDQELNTKLLGIDYQVTDHLNVYAALSKSTATAVTTKRDYNVVTSMGTTVTLVSAGTPLMAATDETYTEFSLGWTF
jgi:hypothetical protein